MLTDDDKKSAYERYGADGPQVEHHHRGHRRGHHGDFYDDDINPEDIFNMFFGGMPPGKYKSKQTCSNSFLGHRMGGRRRTYHFQSNHGAHQRAGHHEVSFIFIK